MLYKQLIRRRAKLVTEYNECFLIVLDQIFRAKFSFNLQNGAITVNGKVAVVFSMNGRARLFLA